MKTAALNILVTPEQVTSRGFRGRQRSVPRNRVAAVVHAPQTYLGSSHRTGQLHVSFLALLDARGHPLLRRSTTDDWSQRELARLRSALDTELVSYPPGTDARVVRRDHPGVVPFWQAHLNITAALAALLLFVVVTWCVVVFGG